VLGCISQWTQVLDPGANSGTKDFSLQYDLEDQVLAAVGAVSDASAVGKTVVTGAPAAAAAGDALNWTLETQSKMNQHLIGDDNLSDDEITNWMGRRWVNSCHMNNEDHEVAWLREKVEIYLKNRPPILWLAWASRCPDANAKSLLESVLFENGRLRDLTDESIRSEVLEGISQTPSLMELVIADLADEMRTQAGNDGTSQ
jgi:hypothetical protein